jgi:hypothetical protein
MESFGGEGGDAYLIDTITEAKKKTIASNRT